MTGLRDIVLLSTADWDNPFWTNKQHVAVELGRRGYRVFYIDSLGLRRPSVSGADLRRITVRVLKALRPPRKVRENLWVWSPIVIPFQGNALARLINRAVLSMGLAFWLRILRMRRDTLWTYNPLTCRLLPLEGFDDVIYHCVDEIKAQPGMPIDEIERSETMLVRAARVCFVTSDHLMETRREFNPNTHYLPNVADFSHFSAAMDRATPTPADVAAFQGPLIGFIGAISAYKLNFDLLVSMAERHPEWSIVLIGKVGEGDPHTNISAFRGITNLHFIGPRQYRDLPGYLKAFSVAILPSALNEYTRSMFPMKFFEYLAAGKFVVATNLPAIQQFRDVACIADGTEKFIAGVEAALRGEGPSLESRLATAREHTYESRTEKMLKLLNYPTASE